MKCLSIDDPTQAFAARQDAARLAVRAGMTDGQAAKLAIVVTEAATNLIKHAGGGTMILSLVPPGMGGGIDVLVLDRGPGMADIGKCLRDGYSTAGSSGTGLGAMARLSTSFDVFSQPGRGTAIHLRLTGDERVPAAAGPWTVGAVSLPIRGEEQNGDAWSLWAGPHRLTLCVADGLGHGPLAAVASREAIRTADALADKPLPDILTAQHGHLHLTRGAAASLARLDSSATTLSFAGIGNVAGVIVDAAGERRTLVTMAGTLGHAVRTIRPFDAPFPYGSLLIMHSDGLTSSWDLAAYPGLTTRHPQLIAGVLARDFDRKRDDLTVVVAGRLS